MTSEPMTATPEDSVDSALKTMLDQNRRHVREVFLESVIKG